MVSPTGQPTSLIICEGDSVFSILVANTSGSTISGSNLILELPDNCKYIQGSILNATELDISNLNRPEFSLPNILNNTSLNINYNAEITCGYDNTQNFTYIVNHNSSVYTGSDSPLQNYYYPSVVITNVTNSSATIQVNQSIVRDFTIEQQGLYASLDSLIIIDEHSTDIEILSVSIGTLIIDPGSGPTLYDTIIITGSDMPGGNNLFDYGETIILSETVKLKGCNNGQSIINATWGCYSEYCENFQVFPTVSPSVGVPLIDMVFTGNNVGWGFVDNSGFIEISVTNNGTGAGTAYNLVTLSGFSSSSSIYYPNNNWINEIDSFSVNGSYLKSFYNYSSGAINGQYAYYFNYGYSSDPDGVGVGIEDADGDGVFDDLPVGHTVVVKAHTYYNWPEAESTIPTGDGCGRGWTNNAWQALRFGYDLTDQCSSVYGISWVPNSNVLLFMTYNTNTLEHTIPADIYNGSTVWMEQQVSTSTRVDDTGCPNDSVIYNVELPEGVIIAGGTPTFKGVSMGTPSYIGNTATFFLNKNKVKSGGWFKVPIQLDCSVQHNPTGSISTNLKFWCDKTLFPSRYFTYWCSSSPVFGIQCPPGLCQDPYTTEFTVKRNTFGWIDNQLSKKVNSSTSGLSLNKAMAMDSIKIIAKGLLNKAYDSLYFELNHQNLPGNWSNHLFFDYIIDTLLFFDQESNDWFICSNLTPEITHGSSSGLRVNLSKLTLPGECYNGLSFTAGDSLIYIVHGQVRNISRTAWETVPGLRANFYNIESNNRKFCNDLGNTFKILGSNYSFWRNTRINPTIVEGCDDLLFIGYIYRWLDICNNEVSFPNEVRPYVVLDTITFNIPNGFSYQPGTAVHRYRNIDGVLVSESISDPIIGYSNNQVNLVFVRDDNWSYSGYVDCSKNQDRIDFNATASCKSESSITSQATMKGRYQFYVDGIGLSAISTANSSKQYFNSEVDLTPLITTAEGRYDTVFWDLRLCNVTNVDAENNWIAFENASNGIEILELIDITNPNNPIVYPVSEYNLGKKWAQLGTLTANSCSIYKVIATYSSCSKDSLEVRHAFNCAGYPVNPELGYLPTAYSCDDNSTLLYLEPNDINLNLQLLSPSNPLELCDTLDYEIEVSNTLLSYAYNLKVIIETPPGITFVTSESELSFPFNSGVFNVISEPENIPVGSNKWVYNISFDPSGVEMLKGIDSIPNNGYKLRFKIVTDCNLISGSSIKVTASATNSCGAEKSRSSFTSPIIINGLPTNVNLYVISTESETYIPTCDTSLIVKSKVINLGPNSVSSIEILSVSIDDAFDYVPGSLVSVHNGPFGISNNLIIDGIRYIQFAIQPNLGINDSIVFYYELIDVDPGSLECDTIAMTTNAMLVASVPCQAVPAGSCEIQSITSSLVTNLIISKDNVEFGEFNGISLPVAPDFELVTVNYSVLNSGNYPFTSDSLNVVFIHDANGNGLPDESGEDSLFFQRINVDNLMPGDSMISTAEFLVVGSKVCNMLAAIRLSDDTCVCAETIISISDIKLLNGGNDTSVCALQNIQVGSDSLLDYNYIWIPSAYLNSSTISNPIFNYTGSIIESDTLLYTLLTTRPGGCINRDTIQIIVYPHANAYAGSNESICENHPFDFSTSSTLPVANNYDSLLWYGGSGVFNYPDSIYPVYIPGFNEFGDVELFLKAISKLNCSQDITSMILTIDSLPDPTFTYMPDDSICVFEPILFTAFNQNNTIISDWQWNFGDGINGSGNSIVHTYILAGNYDVSLIAINESGCIDSLQYIVTVNELPEAEFQILPSDTICAGTEAYFNANSTTNITSWIWEFGDNNSSNGQNTSHIFNTSGLYEIQLIVENENSCSDTVVDSIYVRDFPFAEIINIPHDTSCLKDTVFFSGATSDNIITWDWNFGDGANSTGQHVNHKYNFSGTYYISLLITDEFGCSDTIHDSILIRDQVIADFIVSPSDTSCINDIVSFSGFSNENISNWYWDFGDGNNEQGEQVDHIFLIPGVYNVMLVYTSTSGCMDTIMHQKIIDNPDIKFDIVSNPSCIGDTNTFLNTGDRITYASYIWNFDDGIGTDTGYTVRYSYSQPGTYNVSLDVCSQTVYKSHTVNPVCVVNSGGNQTTCQDVYFNYSTSVSPPTAEGYDSILWITTGLGYFIDPTIIAPTYFPHVTEGAMHNDTLTMTMIGFGKSPCSNDTSYMDLVVIPGAYAEAGSNENSCIDQAYNFANSTDSSFATNYTSLNWYTSGIGYFIDPNVQHPVYIPGAGELGEITLTMVASNIINCDSIDDMILTIHPEYEVPINVTVCYYDSVFLAGDWQYESGIYVDTLQSIFQCDSIIVTNLIVRAKVDKDFQISSGDSLCRGEVINFVPEGIASLLHWYWDFGDGTNSTNYNPSHQYLTTGEYSVIYYFTDINGCSDSSTRVVTVFEIPDIDFNINMNNACVDYPVEFEGESTSNIILWEWDFGDGITGLGQNISITYSSTGNKTVILTITDMVGCQNVIYKQLLVLQPSTADFTFLSISCDSVQFTDLSSSPAGYNIVQWYWEFDDGDTSDLQNPIHVFPPNSNPGGVTYNVSLQITSDSNGYLCSSTKTYQVLVPSNPDIFFTWNPEQTCFGDPTHFYGNSGFPVSHWHWDFGDGHFSNMQNPIHIYSDTGQYNATLSIIDQNGCNNSLSNLILINPIPDVNFIISDSITCHSNLVSFMGLSGNNVAIWFWDFGDGYYSYDTNPIHYYNNPGNYNISLTVFDSVGCNNSMNSQITILPVPTADFNYSNSGCNTFIFSDQSLTVEGYNIVEWVWDFGDGTTSTVQNPSHNYSGGADIYSVSLIVVADSGGFSCADTVTEAVITDNLPSVYFTWDPEPTMLGDQTEFFGTSGNSVTNWHWDFDDGNFSTSQNTEHVYSESGTYDVNLSIIDAIGCQNVVTNQVSISNPPELDFSWNKSCVGDPVQFTIESPPTDILSVVLWSWDFGDGGISNDMEPQHVYSSTGAYNVKLTIIDIQNATATLSKQINVTPPPISFFSTEYPVCEGNDIEFIDYSSTSTGTITKWHWDFGDGTSQVVLYPDNPDVSHMYSVPGIYNASLSIENSDSCIDLYQSEVVVSYAPIAMYEVNNSCATTPVHFNDISLESGGGQIINYLWIFDDPESGANNYSNLQNPLHVFESPGDYDVMLIVTNINDCSDSIINVVTISEQPIVDFDYTESCLGEETEFTSESTSNILTYYWSFGDGVTSDLQNPSHLYSNPGSYDVVLSILTTDSCNSDVSKSVKIRPLPIPDFTSNDPGCINTEIEFIDLSISANGLIELWDWDFGDGTTATVNYPDLPNQNHIYTLSGNYSISLTVTDEEGCENQMIKQVEIVNSPIADYSYEETCFNDPVIFTDLSTTVGGFDIQNWIWYFGDPGSGTQNTSNLQNPSHLYSSTDTFNTVLIVTSTAGCTDTVVNEIIVDTLPYVNFTVTNDSICQGEYIEFSGIGTNISSWYWDFGDGGNSIEQNPVYLYSSPGIYTVSLTVTGSDAEGCTNFVSDMVVVSGRPNADFDYEKICKGDSTYFTDQSYSQYAFISQWNWDFGDGGTATSDDPVHYYQNTADFQITLVVSDNIGCSDTNIKIIHIYEPPITSFSYNQVCDPSGLVNFFDESEPGFEGSPISEWSWDFSNGNHSTEIDPDYIFPHTDSCYTVSLEVTDLMGCSTSDTIKQICLYGDLLIDFTSTVECFGKSTFFETEYKPYNDSILAYIWSFNDGSGIDTTYYDTINHVFTHPGNFIVSLTVVDTNGCNSNIHKEVKVDSLPTPKFLSSSSSCSKPIHFTDISHNGGVDINIWNWSFGDSISFTDNISTLQNPEHIYGLNDSTYKVKLVATNQNGCIDSVVQDVFVEPCLIADFILSEYSCEGFIVYPQDSSQIFSNNTEIESWQWSFGDGSSYEYETKVDSFPHIFEKEGDFNVQLIVSTELSGSTYSDTVNQIITVYPRPAVDISFENTCFGDTTYYFGITNSTGPSISSWRWDFGDTTFAYADTSLRNPIYYYPAIGTYNARLKIISNQGCCNVDTSIIKINSLPKAEFSFEESCKGYYTFFKDKSQSDNSEIATYNWDFGDANNPNDFSILPNPVYIFENSETYNVNLIVVDENTCVDNVSHPVKVFPVPIADFTIIETDRQGQIHLSNSSEGASSWLWDLNYNHGEYSSEFNPIVQYEVDGSYEIMLISTNVFGCPDTSYKVYDIVFTNLFVPNAFVPSGSNTELQTFMPVGINIKQYKVQIYSAWGNLVFESSKLENGSPVEGWNGRYIGEDLPSGSYMWKISAVFKDGTIWEGSDNGDGNKKTSGTVVLIR
jgi:PKD repeat protein